MTTDKKVDETAEVKEVKRKLGITIPTERFPVEYQPVVRGLREIQDTAQDKRDAAQTDVSHNRQLVNGMAKSFGLIRASDYGADQNTLDALATFDSYDQTARDEYLESLNESQLENFKKVAGEHGVSLDATR